MKAVTYDRYGARDVLKLADVETPEPGDHEVQIRVHASSVTTADWRLRASAFPGILWLPGRLMTGLFKPKNRVLGMDLAGTVENVGPGVTKFAMGDRLFGFVGKGGHAEFAVVSEDAALARIPDRVSFEEAAALPWGGLAALVFLRDFAQIKDGQSVLIVGGSGGVGAYAIQIAKALGAEVTAVASGANLNLLRDLGADHVVDYQSEDVTRGKSRFHVLFETVGVVGFRDARRVLKPGGLFLPLNFGGREILQALNPLPSKAGHRIKLQVNPDRADDLVALADMVRNGTLKPVIGHRFSLDQIKDAYAVVESRHRKGAVVVSIA